MIFSNYDMHVEKIKKGRCLQIRRKNIWKRDHQGIR